jgi:hypothetical protein
MKQPSVKPQDGQNWTWPRKTWLQQRLDLIKAREREMQQKSTETPEAVTGVDSEATGDKELDER